MKRLFYFLVLMGAFTVTQPGCGLLFFPLPEVEEPADDPVEEETEEEGLDGEGTYTVEITDTPLVIGTD